MARTMPTISVITGNGFDFDGEVPQVVHTSVTGAGSHTEAPGWPEGRWGSMAPTLGAKTAIQDRCRAAGFPHWTLLKRTSSRPWHSCSRAESRAAGERPEPGTRLSLVAVDDIGAAAATRMPAMGASHEWLNVAGQPGRPRYARDLGIPLTSFDAWAREHLRA